MKVGTNCFYSEGVTPTLNDVKKENDLGFKSKVLARIKNGVFSAVKNKSHKLPFKVRLFQLIKELLGCCW